MIACSDPAPASRDRATADAVDVAQQFDVQAQGDADSAEVAGQTDGSSAVDAADSAETAGLDGAGDLASESCPGGPDCACVQDNDCTSTLCIDTPIGRRCARTCTTSCPGG